MTRLLALAVAVAAIAAAPVYASHGSSPTAQATQHPIGQSGAKGRIDFSVGSAGQTLARGTATGLQPSVGRYVSLVYDVGSVPGGPTRCEPTTELAGMFVGIWSVDAQGVGTLIQVFDPADPLAPIGSFDTVSIRDTTINGGFGPQAVVACGQVAVHPGG